ncbi:MAG TPA: spore germination protein GerW family protein [Pirellulales bacterium]|jgi:uncharacterized spore protein YtfJ|nr:spore germination protein GerW family protein [Pirellulales bacterium]
MIDDGVVQQTKKRKSSFVERVIERMGLHVTAKAVYADPVVQNGITVIPVAKLRWGFGGGSGHKQGKRGKGGGGGMQAAPLGYIEIKEGQTQFKPIRDPMAFVPIAAASALAGWILLRSVRKLIRG